VSAEELVQRGDEICRDVERRFDEVQAEPLSTPRQGANQAGELLEVADEAQAELRDLEPPEEERDVYDLYLDERDEVSDLIQRGKDAAEAQDGAAFAEAQQEAAAGGAERRKLARQLGFELCSQGTGAP
jgi:hypothetical protein